MNIETRYVDRRVLTGAAYATGGHLAARQAIYRYAVAQTNLADWVLAHLPWEAVRLVVDIGCGNGAYLTRLGALLPPGARTLGLDLSLGMLRDAQRAGAILLSNADIQALPLPNASCDVALAMHMLYHVPDILQAARELRRVLRSGGTFVASTNGLEHLGELRDAFDSAIRALAPDAPPFQFGAWRFTLENGAELLGAAFDRIERRDLTDELRITDVEALLAYFDSTRSMQEPELPPDVTWEAARAELARQTAATIAREGALQVRTVVGIFICRS